jgi:hypothetical protein
MNVIKGKELSDFCVNQYGGIDATWNNDGEMLPYTLSDDEKNEVLSEVAPFDSLSHSQAVAISQFKADRQKRLNNAIVTTSNGNKYDADEQSISRMANAILAARRRGVRDIKWSLADTPTGVMTDVTLADLEEAHELAVENMASIWSI